MDEPLIQIVNEHDELVGSATIAEAQAQGLYHRVVRVMVFDEAGKLLLQKRSDAMDTFPNCWDNSVAGHVDADVTREQAADRKARKELGVSLQLTELGTYASVEPFQELRLKRFTTAYEAKLDDTLTINQDEISEVAWFTLSEAHALIAGQPDSVTPGLHDVLTRYYA